MVASNFPNRPFGLRENCWVRYQDVGANKTNMGCELWIDRYNSNYGTYGSGSFSFHINGGQVAGWSFSFDFRNYNNLRLAYAEVDVYHNADGGKTFGIDGYCNADVMGGTEVHAPYTPPTIPRASTASFQGDNILDAGVYEVINTNRAANTFSHDIDWYFGNASGRAVTGALDSAGWTVPMSLLQQIPTSTRGTGKIRTHTYSNGNMIGWTETPFDLVALPDVVPTWTGTSISDGTANVQSVIGAGRYLQNISKLVSTISGASGVYGSSISSYNHSVGSESINAATANFTKVLPTAGTAVPVVQEITDSRGRKKSLTTNINVMPYSRPVVTQVNQQRVNASGANDPNGTRMKVSIVGAVQSIINSTERNRMTVKVLTKTRSSSTWSVDATPVNDSATLAYNGSVILEGPFSTTSAYDVKVEISDKFSTSSGQKTLTTGEIFQHWSTGAGFGKYWEKGMIDAAGDVYASGGMLSLGKRVTNLNDAIYEGRYHANGPSGLPGGNPIYTLRTDPLYGQVVVDVDTWYEVQSTTTFHYIRQRARWINTDVGNPSRRNLQTSFLRGYAMTRISTTGGASWGPWATEEPNACYATATGGLGTFDYINNRFTTSGSHNYMVVDGVFRNDTAMHRVDYYYRTLDNNGNIFQLRSNNAYVSGLNYNWQNVWVTGTGTPGAQQAANNSRGQISAVSGDVHWGYIIFQNLMINGAVKTWYGHHQTAAGQSYTSHGGHFSGANADNVQFDGFLLQTSSALNNMQAGGWMKITAIG